MAEVLGYIWDILKIFFEIVELISFFVMQHPLIPSQIPTIFPFDAPLKFLLLY